MMSSKGNLGAELNRPLLVSFAYIDEWNDLCVLYDLSMELIGLMAL